jgi:uncharacterized protein
VPAEGAETTRSGHDFHLRIRMKNRPLSSTIVSPRGITVAVSLKKDFFAMSRTALTRITDVFTTRLQTLDRLMEIAQAQWREKSRDTGSLLTARLADDMVPFPHQIVYACNQPNHFAAWCADTPTSQTDPASLDFDGLKRHVQRAIGYLAEATGPVDDSVLARDKRIDLQAGMFLSLSGARYVEDWLMPNFYFHLVTAYDILRREGVQIGKADYMRHLAGDVRPATAG